MDTFNYSYHRQSTAMPQNGFRLQFGTSYVFTAKPDAPDQRVFTLFFTGMQYYLHDDGTVDGSTGAGINNVHALYTFYAAHGLWDTFIYPHPVFGNVTVKFKDPLVVPEGIVGGGGVVGDFQITLEEQP